MDWKKLFVALAHAESEEEVTRVLGNHQLLQDHNWLPFGGNENNWGTMGNQQDDPTGALIEKIINSIDAILTLETYRRGIDPEGTDAPQSMSDAVERYFGIRAGRLENITAKERTQLAGNIQIVATGSRESPCLWVIDQGEGQTPQQFPDTLVSLNRSNKLKIPFVQGRFNTGGTGVLPFCGKSNYQLIASKRAPGTPVKAGDTTAGQWGFTLVRRLLPADGRKNSMYVYLAPSNVIPAFDAKTLHVLPLRKPGEKIPVAYAEGLEYGTVIKLYNYAWAGRTLLTTEARFLIEKNFHGPCLPFRLVETRQGFRANYFETTFAGIWVRTGTDESQSSQMDEGFPTGDVLDIDEVGRVPIRLALFKEETLRGGEVKKVKTRNIPSGVFFTLNGQVHGVLPSDFISRRVKFDYLDQHLLVSVDCTQMNERVREDFFMASRDRLRRNDVYQKITTSLQAYLSEHPGLRELNARRRAKSVDDALKNAKQSEQLFQDLVKSDPSLAALFGVGETLVTSLGPVNKPIPFHGRRFPGFFRLAKTPDNLVKPCPVNWRCRVEFETDAANDYFSRAESPGEMRVTPEASWTSRTLFNGRCIMYFRPPAGGRPGDQVNIEVHVTDDSRPAHEGPFVSQFRMDVGEERDHSKGGGKGGPIGPGGGTATAPTLAMPNVYEVRRDHWDRHNMGSIDAIRIKSSGDEEGEKESYDFYVNMDNAHLLTALQRYKREDPGILEYWFKYGLALLAAAMLKPPEIKGRNVDVPSKEAIEDAVAGLGRVLIPIILKLPEIARAAEPPELRAVE